MVTVLYWWRRFGTLRAASLTYLQNSRRMEITVFGYPCLRLQTRVIFIFKSVLSSMRPKRIRILIRNLLSPTYDQEFKLLLAALGID